MVKKGKGKPVKKVKKTPVKHVQSAPKTHDPVASEDSDINEDMLDMVDEEDLEFLKSAITNKSYSFLDKIKHNE